MKRTWKKWTVADEKRLMEMVNSGIQLHEIGNMMGRTPQSIYTRIQEIKKRNKLLTSTSHSTDEKEEKAKAPNGGADVTTLIEIQKTLRDIRSISAFGIAVNVLILCVAAALIIF